MSARKNRPHARINLVRTHNVPAMTLAKNANTEPKDTTYNKNFIASLHFRDTPRSCANACDRMSRSFQAMLRVEMRCPLLALSGHGLLHAHVRLWVTADKYERRGISPA